MKITPLKSFASPHRHQRGSKTTFLPVIYKLKTNSNVRTGFIFSVFTFYSDPVRTCLSGQTQTAPTALTGPLVLLGCTPFM